MGGLLTPGMAGLISAATTHQLGVMPVAIRPPVDTQDGRQLSAWWSQ